MSVNAWVQLVLFLAVLLAAVKPLGWYMARVFQGQPCGLDRVLGLPRPTIDIFMAPHHGSKTSNKPELAAWARPSGCRLG